MKYSIWTVPPAPLSTQLQGIIDDLGAKYNAPHFPPHMTLLGSVEAEIEDMKHKVEKVAKKFVPFEVILGPVSFSTTYYQSVFVRVLSNASLMQLNLDLKSAFKLENTVFMPHISLMYGEHDMETREKITHDLIVPQAHFMIEEIQIIPETTEPNTWKPAAIISLK
ncbi:MAG: 2'-5' RNA ligase family protein [Weeksellaceae bacterium]